jgi:hypothetical protein
MDPVLTPVLAVRDKLEVPAEQRMEPGASPGHAGTEHLDQVQLTTWSKAQVERPMPYIRDSFWRGRDFTSVEQMQAEAVRWCEQVAGRRSCRPLDGAAPAAVFAAVEKDNLAPLPRTPFVLAEWARCKVGPDIHAKVGQSLYSVPWKHLGKTLDARSPPRWCSCSAAGI